MLLSAHIKTFAARVGMHGLISDLSCTVTINLYWDDNVSVEVSNLSILSRAF